MRPRSPTDRQAQREDAQNKDRVVLRDVENRVLLPPGLGHQGTCQKEVGAWIEDRYNRRRRRSQEVRSPRFPSKCDTQPRLWKLKTPHNPRVHETGARPKGLPPMLVQVAENKALCSATHNEW